MACKQAVPYGLRQCRACVEKHATARQQIFAQISARWVISLHGSGDLLVAGGHVEILRGRYLAQVAQGLAHQRGGGLAVVNVQRAAVVQRQAKIMVAAKGVVPRQPVHQHGRLFGQAGHRLGHLLLVGANHALRVNHGFGQLGRTTGEEKFNYRVAIGSVHGARDLWGNFSV